MNKKITLYFITILLLFFSLSCDKTKTKKWAFVGYQYRWNTDYAENWGFASEMECVAYGDNWLQKQSNPKALYTCGHNCKKNKYGLDICEKVCEYDRNGLIGCRK